VAAESLVIDASAAAASCLAGDQGFALYRRYQLVAPPLLWPEVRSALHQISWRGDLEAEEVTAAHERFEGAPVRPRTPRTFGPTVWQIAEEFGWAKTYDAEYLALARLLSCRLVTLDRRLHRRVADPQLVIGPTEL
jgi:predicted nucleic acid-binding protein